MVVASRRLVVAICASMRDRCAGGAPVSASKQKGIGMTCTTGVAHGVGQHWSVEDVGIGPALAGEARVQRAHADRCHRGEEVRIGELVPLPDGNTRGVFAQAS